MDRVTPPNARLAIQRGEVLTLEQSGFVGDLTRYRTEAFERQYGQVLFVWWATTGTGRQARYFRLDGFDRLQSTATVLRHKGVLRKVVVPSKNFAVPVLELARMLCEQRALPALPAGYTWHGPYLVAEHPIPAAEGLYDGRLFRRTEPKRGQAHRRARCEPAQAGALARELLSARATAHAPGA